MPFALIIIGVTLIVAAVQNTHMDLVGLVKGDFSGPNNFVWWLVLLVILGGIGYIDKLKGVSIAMITLVMLVLVLYRGKPGAAEGGFFQKFIEAVKGTETASNPVASVIPFPGQVSA